MDEIVNTEMYYFDGKDGFLYLHFPVRGYALKTDISNDILVKKLAQREQLSSQEKQHPLVSGLREKMLLGSAVKPLPVMADLTEFKPVEATLLLTESCNLACSYCYAKATTNKFAPMTREVAKGAIDLVIENARSHKNKTAEFRFLGGGEPTLEWDLIVWSTHYIRLRADERGVKCWIRLITNGVLINDEKAKWIAKHIHYVTLSCDILPDLQQNRAFPNGKNSHKAVMRAASLLCKHGVPCHFRTTISFGASDRLREMVEYTHQHTDVKTIRFEPMAEIGRASDTDMNKPAQQAFVDDFIAAYELGKEYGIMVTCKMMSNISRRSTRFCNVEFAVTAEGNVAGCHRYSRKNNAGFDFYHVGAWRGRNFSFDTEKINALRRVDTRAFPQCQTCFARWSCASGCLSARMQEGEINQTGPLCHLTKELLKFSIKEALNA
ncbi:radical SAM/SPASM domain-containing protein [Cronobacter dublinensis]|uniref:radical SAM/SPASM domain-containing protein n=1 Tax=Cronobacter dublinensis TaxID=413497 RepID=UPI00029BDB1C|nr:radical SAM protein [Cronobacter dublinensis]CCJ84656.1 Radical SAM domain protein [Cronobacter dublinensis 582]ELY6212356.1 radical SAM protein [Cronobacter dublinensis]EMD9246056.1 radical SAM protein [Cronobacter dublinensis]MDI6439544.1 radical SAM protein [Cronobacter dublinensis]MDI6443901.1 radical SAM protein [Cronobacter dublinensis]